ncbi:MAG: hypothetical protein AB8G95_23630, partial [Anaerolineae bacterium]
FAPQWFYTVCNLLVVIGVIGLLLKLTKGKRDAKSGIILPVLMVFVTMILLIRWTIISPAFQGRLLFPALIGVNVLWVMGLKVMSDRWSVTNHRWQPVPVLSALFFLVMAALIPFTHLAPAYAYPEPTTVPADAEFGPITYTDENGESISLVGAELEPRQTAVPSDQVGVAVTLYWTTETGVSTDYVTAVHALGREFKSVGQVDRHPGWGMWPPTRWQAGEVYADPYHVWLNPGSKAPSLLQLDVSVTDTSGPKNRILTPTGVDGSELELVLVGEAKLGVEEYPPETLGPQSPVSFADFIELETMTITGEFAAGNELLIDLYWRAKGAPSKDYTVFVQLVDNENNLLVSGDGPPLNGDYPTSWWANNEMIADRKSIQIPAEIEPGTYKLLVGMYDPLSPTGEKLPRLDNNLWVETEIEIR